MTSVLNSRGSASEIGRLTRELHLTKNEVAQIFVEPARFYAKYELTSHMIVQLMYRVAHNCMYNK